MGAVAWAMRHRSVSHPRSSNRTCRSPASGSLTGFTVWHTEKITDRKRQFARRVSSFTSPSSKAHQKSGSFPPPALPGFIGRMTPSDSRQCRRLQATLRPLPSHQTGLPRLPESPFRRAEPTTPADRAGAHIDCFPAHAAFPLWQGGRHPHCHFRGPLRLHSGYGPPDRSAAHRRPLSRGSNPCSCPHEPLQLPDQSLRVESSSTDNSRLRGALPTADSCTAAK
jgi:hypothetical protein